MVCACAEQSSLSRSQAPQDPGIRAVCLDARRPWARREKPESDSRLRTPQKSNNVDRMRARGKAVTAARARAHMHIKLQRVL